MPWLTASAFAPPALCDVAKPGRELLGGGALVQREWVLSHPVLIG